MGFVRGRFGYNLDRIQSTIVECVIVTNNGISFSSRGGAASFELNDFRRKVFERRAFYFFYELLLRNIVYARILLRINIKRVGTPAFEIKQLSTVSRVYSFIIKN